MPSMSGAADIIKPPLNEFSECANGVPKLLVFLASPQGLARTPHLFWASTGTTPSTSKGVFADPISFPLPNLLACLAYTAGFLTPLQRTCSLR